MDCIDYLIFAVASDVARCGQLDSSAAFDAPRRFLFLFVVHRSSLRVFLLLLAVVQFLAVSFFIPAADGPAQNKTLVIFVYH